MGMLSVADKIEYYKGLIYKELLLILSDIHESKLKQAMEYMLLNGGKRLRPILCIGTCELLGIDVEKSVRIACILEIMHTYSLIHDDLPAMDDDIERRGMPTCHVKFDEATAILAGDALLNLVFEIASECQNITDLQKINIIKTISKASGSNGMLLGQMMDIEYQEKEFGLNELKQMHKLKTGALFVASVEIGGIISNATPQIMLLLKEFGESFGALFQIADDIDDIHNPYEANIANLAGYDKAVDLANWHYLNAKKILEKLKCDNFFILWYILNSINMDYKI